MVQFSKPPPKQLDPSFTSYSNFAETIDQEKVFSYLSTPGNKFDKGIKKLLNMFKRRSLSAESDIKVDLASPEESRVETRVETRGELKLDDQESIKK